MSRFGRTAASIAQLCIAVLLTSTQVAPVDAQANDWQPAPSNENPFRAETVQWQPSRAHLKAAPRHDSALPPSTGSLNSVEGDSAWSTPSTPGVESNRRARSPQPATQESRNAHVGNADSRWLLPNEKPVRTVSHVAPSRESMKGEAEQEPQAFIPPTAAAPIDSDQRAARPSLAQAMASSPGEPRRTTPAGQNATVSQYTGSAAVASPRQFHRADASEAPRTARNAPFSHEASRRNPSPANQRRAAQAPPSNHRHAAQGAHSGSYASRLYDTITVAFEGRGSWAAFEEGEELPMPGPNGSRIIKKHVDHVPMLQEEGGYEIIDGPVFSDGYGGYGDEIYYGEGGYGCADGICGCADACDPGCGCGLPGDSCILGTGDCEACQTIRIRVPKWQELMIFGGVQGFKGPYDQSRDSGNFGFHEGFNAGFKVPYSSLGYQIGYQATHSQLSGDKDTNIADPHTQQFLTAGLFQRTKHGFQGGVVYDVLRDERWGAVDFHQIRAEISYIDRGSHEFGFAGAFHLNEHETASQDDVGTTIWRATDQYLLFYRFHGKRGGEGRFYAGVTDDSDAIIGSDMTLPLTDRWSLQPGFTYLIPEESGGTEGARQEAWNIGIAMVWHWDCRARKCYSNGYRPLFNVANNGYLIVDGRPGAAPVNGAPTNNFQTFP